MAKKNRHKKAKYLTLAMYCLAAVAVMEKLQQATYESRLESMDRKIRLSNMSPTLMPNPQTQLSRHDRHIERTSEVFQIDWRLTAAVISVESSFNDKAKSSAGAVGLMQVMPIVYKEQNKPVSVQPEINIEVGLTHFKKLYERISADTPHDRLKMTFAAYNAGIGHLRDAQRLARSKKLNPYKWDDLAKIYPELENASVHRQLTYGYCQGRSVVAYVKKVSRQYEAFQRLYPINRLQLSHSAQTEHPTRS